MTKKHQKRCPWKGPLKFSEYTTKRKKEKEKIRLSQKMTFLAFRMQAKAGAHFQKARTQKKSQNGLIITCNIAFDSALARSEKFEKY
jgi:hypothetical protein